LKEGNIRAHANSLLHNLQNSIVKSFRRQFLNHVSEKLKLLKRNRMANIK